MRRFAFGVLVVVVVLAMASVALAGKPESPGKPTTTTTTATTPPVASNCAAEGNQGNAIDGIVEAAAGGSNNWCDDIRNEENGTVFRFDFSVTPADKLLRAGFVLGIRNSVPGDWCGGFWSLYDHTGAPVFENAMGNAINPGPIGEGWYATLVVNEQFAPDGNCTADGDLLWYDDDPNWVLTLGGGAGKPLKGDEAISVTWTPWNQPTP